MMHGTFCFMDFQGYGWYLSSTASLLYVSSWIHNFVAWLKVRPFVVEPNYIFTLETGKIIAMTYRITLALSVVPISLQIVNNFQFFNNINERYAAFRPYETLMRYAKDSISLGRHSEILTRTLGIRGGCSPASFYSMSSPNAMAPAPWNSSNVLLALESSSWQLRWQWSSPSWTLSPLLKRVWKVERTGTSAAPTLLHLPLTTLTRSINPWWKLYLVFKCATDTIMLDDFKTELSRLRVAPRQSAHQQTTSPGYHDLENHGLNETYAPVATRVNSTAGSKSLDDRLPMSRTAKALSTIRMPVHSDQIKIARLSTLEDGRIEYDKPATWHREHVASEFELFSHPSSFSKPTDAPHEGLSYGQWMVIETDEFVLCISVAHFVQE
jgi:hypothetical protein